MLRKSWKTACGLLILFATGCKTPPVPPEVGRSAEQERLLWGAGASFLADPDYPSYLRDLWAARRRLREENLKLGWFRDYRAVAGEFGSVLKTGERILQDIRTRKEKGLTGYAAALGALRRKATLLDTITLSTSERGKGRQSLARAEVFLREADMLAGRGKYDQAMSRISLAGEAIRLSEEAVSLFLSRYLDRGQIAVWKTWADATIEESRIGGTTAILVSKLEKKLTVYRRGLAVAAYDIGLGFNGLSDKRHAGDNATPEGRYEISKKNPSSRYYRALLINYPNEEDRRRFSREKMRGNIPRAVGIGGMVEIHGGGKDVLTRGCISVDDDVMERLYEMVSIGTSVTIIGTMEVDSPILKAIREKK